MFVLHSFVLECQLSLSPPKAGSLLFVPRVHSGCDCAVPGPVLAYGGQYPNGTCTDCKAQCGQVGDPVCMTLMCQLSDELPAPVTEAAAYKA